MLISLCLFLFIRLCFCVVTSIWLLIGAKGDILAGLLEKTSLRQKMSTLEDDILLGKDTL